LTNTLPNNYGGLPPEYTTYSDSEIVVLPVPFDKTSSWIKGADRGPQALINASCNMELYDIETRCEVYKKGIHTAEEIIADDTQSMVDEVHEKVRGFLKDNKFTVVLGGEHSVSLGTIKAHAEHYDDITVLHLDAHSDMRDAYEGDRLSHACVMARAKEVAGRVVSVGIRSMDSSELDNIIPENIFYASDINRRKDWQPKVLDRLSGNVYISIDLDVFDPSIMPSTGTPEPGGLGWYEVLDLLEMVSKKKNIVGFDVVELCPSDNVAPDFLAAKLIYKLLSYKHS